MTKSFVMRVSLFIMIFQATLPGQKAQVKPSDKIYLGFLDDKRELVVNWKPGVAAERIIRPAFERSRLGWKQVERSSLPPRLQWTVAFDGKKLGRLESATDSDGDFTIIQNILTPSASIPSIGSPSEEFAGLLAGKHEFAVH